MNRPERLQVSRAPGLRSLLAAVGVCAVVVGVMVWGPEASPAPAHREPTSPPAAGAAFTMMQMNLCLSGAAGCYGATAYPAVVSEAVARIRESRPDAVTLNEACGGDAVEIARRAGYHMTFARVIYARAPFPCIDPDGRGLFGHALLTREPVTGSETEAFTAQAGPEERRWLCVTTDDGVDVCTAHLETPYSSRATVARDGQCSELADVLATRKSDAVVFGGDLNRKDSCAPAGAWSRTDAAAHQAPGIQHVYGSAALRFPVAEVVPSAFSDHDVLLVRARLAPRHEPSVVRGIGWRGGCEH